MPSCAVLSAQQEINSETDWPHQRNGNWQLAVLLLVVVVVVVLLLLLLLRLNS
jgi:hypothetical protein